LLNFVTNAFQAMPNGGQLSAHACRDAKTADFVIEVEGTGLGIPEEVRDRLFRPLFTTKSKRQGFGLAVVKRLTEALNETVTF
jgi:signal transduction histidine kinase